MSSYEARKQVSGSVEKLMNYYYGKQLTDWRGNNQPAFRSLTSFDSRKALGEEQLLKEALDEHEIAIIESLHLAGAVLYTTGAFLGTFEEDMAKDAIEIPHASSNVEKYLYSSFQDTSVRETFGLLCLLGTESLAEILLD